METLLISCPSCSWTVPSALRYCRGTRSKSRLGTELQPTGIKQLSRAEIRRGDNWALERGATVPCTDSFVGFRGQARQSCEGIARISPGSMQRCERGVPSAAFQPFASLCLWLNWPRAMSGSLNFFIPRAQNQGELVASLGSPAASLGSSVASLGSPAASLHHQADASRHPGTPELWGAAKKQALPPAPAPFIQPAMGEKLVVAAGKAQDVSADSKGRLKSPRVLGYVSLPPVGEVWGRFHIAHVSECF